MVRNSADAAQRRQKSNGLSFWSAATFPCRAIGRASVATRLQPGQRHNDVTTQYSMLDARPSMPTETARVPRFPSTVNALGAPTLPPAAPVVQKETAKHEQAYFADDH